MNVIINNCKQRTNGAINLLKNSDNLLRRYANIADYKITWVRPEKVPNLSPAQTGDQGLEIEVKSSDFCNMYDKSHELKDASDIVKKLFTLRFLPRKEITNIKREKILELVKRHELDRRSPEATIALMTSEILNLQEYMKEHPTNKQAKITLNEMVGKRRKLLKHLRTWDYRRFEWILEKLNLLYKPIPEKPWQVTRKDSLKRLTKDHCNKLVQGKLDAYKRELKELQEEFYKEKAEKLLFIQKEEFICKLKPSVTEEDIKLAQQKAAEYKI